jgi:hypothetical protein
MAIPHMTLWTRGAKNDEKRAITPVIRFNSKLQGM